MNDLRHGLSAVVGAGFIGPVHVEALRRIGRPMVGLLASSPQKGLRLAAALKVARVYESYEELLADENVGAVHLATPNRLHFGQCRLALAAGKHVICEKPLGMNVAETAELVRLARAAKTVAAVCYNVRYYPLCIEARERIANGELGTIHHVTGSYLQDWLLHETDFNWRVLAAEGGELRAVADIGTHWMDLVTWITGLAIESVCADLKTILPTRYRPKGSVETFAEASRERERPEDSGQEQVSIDTEDYGSVLFHFHGGARGSYTVSQVTAGRKNCLRFEIAGSKGSLAWNSERSNELWIGRRDRANELLIRDPALLGASARRYANYPGGHSEGFPDTFKQLFRSVYDYIDGADFSAPRAFPTFDDGHREVQLCEAILKSQRARTWIDVPN